MELPVSTQEALFAFGLVIFGAALQGSIGFGLGPLCAPILILINPVFIPGPLLGQDGTMNYNHYLFAGCCQMVRPVYGKYFLDGQKRRGKVLGTFATPT